MSHHIGLQVLRAKVRGLQAAGISIHNHIRKSQGPKRNKLWNKKRSLGYHSREHLIAYGLLRGIPYERIERCAGNNTPNASRVFELMKEHGTWQVVRDLTLDQVKQLLTWQPADGPTRPPTLPTEPRERPLAAAE